MQDTGQSHNTKADNKGFEYVAKFKHFWWILANQNYIHEIKSSLKLENSCHHLAQNLSSSYILPKNLNIKIYKTLILPVLYECEIWSHPNRRM
jgi:hypothetical protein